MASLIVTIFEPKIRDDAPSDEDNTEFPIQTIINQTLLGEKDPPLTSTRSFRDTITYLKSKCNHSQTSIWIKQLALPIIFRIRDDKFKSTTLDESFFVGTENTNRNRYHYFEFFEANDKQFKHPILTLRTDKSGVLGELTWIQKRKSLAGNQLKEIGNKIFDYLKMQFSYTNDESERKLPIDISTLPKGETGHLHLKGFLGVSSDEGDTWYEKSNYFPADFTNVRTFERKIKKFMYATQSAAYYYAALEKVRNTKIADLFHNSVFISYENTRNDLLAIAERYKEKLGIITSSTEPTVIDFGNSTVHDLGKILLETSKKDESSNSHIHYDLLAFQRMFLTPYDYDKEIDKSLCDYNLAIDVIWRHFIWKKDFSKTDRPISFKSFIEKPHETFDQIVGSLFDPEGIDWDDLVKEKMRPILKRSLSEVEEVDPSQVETKKIKLDPSMIIEEVPWYSSPENFLEEMHNDPSIIQNKIELNSVWIARITVPKEWHANPNQQETHLFLEIKPFNENGLQFSLREYPRESSIEAEMETKPILLNLYMTTHASLEEFIQPGELIDKTGLKHISYIIAGSLRTLIPSNIALY